MSILQKLKYSIHPELTKMLRSKHNLTIVFWESTLRCCYACRHCGLNASQGIKSTDIPKEKMISIFDELAEAYSPKEIFIGVTGGEPLLRKDLFEIMGHAKNLGFNWGMVTNGFFVNNETIEQMKTAGMNTVAVSLDGLEENHNWVRNNPNAFKKAVEAIKLLKTANSFQVVEIITTVTKKNLQELDAIYEYINKLGINDWRIMPVTPVGRASTNKDLDLSPKDLAMIIKYIARKRGEAKKINITLNEMFFCGPEYEFEVRDGGFFCPAGVNTIAILSNGDLNGCPLIDGMVEGNVYIDNVVEVWENKFRDYRDINWKRNGECSECKDFNYCGGGEMHLRDKKTGQIKTCNYMLMRKYYEKQK